MRSSEPSQVRSWLDFDAVRPSGDPAVPEAIEAGFTYGHESRYPDPLFSPAAFEAGGTIDVMGPCSVLAELTGQALEGGMDRLTDDELIGVLRAARRVVSWQTAVELAAVAELAARRQSAYAGAAPSADERTSAELAAALTLTSRAADRMLDVAQNVARLEPVACALARGEIDPPRAQVFADELAAQPYAAACTIATGSLIVAADLTTSQLRARLRRAVLAADPEAGQRRQREARQNARIEMWPETSGNAAVAGRELPAARALLADRHLSALARSLQDAGLAGTLDQVRAEVFLALLSGQSPESLLAGTGSAPGTAPEMSSRPQSRPSSGSAPEAISWPSGPRGVVHLTVPLSSWTGIGDSPGEVAGYGPADAWACRELAGAMAGSPGVRYCVSVTNPNGRPLGHACATRPPPRAGPAGLAPWLRSLSMEWLPIGHCDHSRETARYRPSRALDHLLKIRNPTCTAPGCRRAAAACDIDHVIPYHLGGRTCECNLHPLCRRHHRCKGSAGWRLDMPEPGVLSWRLPHGRSYLTRAEPYPV